MAFTDMREFIAELERRGLLKRIRTQVDCELEITEITDRVSKMEGKKNVADSLQRQGKGSFRQKDSSHG